MLSRALILATVMISIGPNAVAPVQAQNLDAGKSPSQIFSSTCSACHRSQRGLLKTVQPGALPGFLREHYTTSRDMAQSLSAYVLSNGATDNRIGGGRLTKQGEDAKAGRQAGEPRPGDAAEPTVPGRRPPRSGSSQDVAQPDADGLLPTDPRAARSKRGRAEPPQVVPGADGQPVATDEAAPVIRQKQKMGKKKGRDVSPKGTPAPVDAAKPAETKPVEPKPVELKPVEPKPVETTTPEPERPAPAVEPVRPPTPNPDVAVEPPARPVPPPVPSRPVDEPSSPVTRPDPVPQVTPAPRQAEPAEAPPAPAPAPAPAPVPAPSETTVPAAPSISVTPPPPPPPPSGPATPPISQ